MKRIISLWMSVILLWSAVATVLPAWAEELPAPYAWLETADGTLQTSDGVRVTPLGGRGRADVLPLANGDGYGIRLDEDWSGFSLEGDIFGNVPAGEGAVLAVEYYADLDAAVDAQVFRYQLGGTYGDGSHVDLFTLKNGLVGRQTGLRLIPLSADTVAAARADAAYAVQFMACPGGKEVTYIRSVRLVAPQYAAASVDGREFLEFAQRPLCDYYPAITGMPSSNMSYRDLEQSKDLPDVPWLYRYVRVHGNTYTPDETVRRAVYVKLYAAAGYENAAVEVQSFEREPNQWGEGAVVQMTDGEGGVFLPSVCFGNRLNGNGSMRFTWLEAPKVARVEVFDVENYCASGAADAATTAFLHTVRLSHGFGTAVEGYRPPVAGDGYSGDVVCTDCGAVLKTGQTIPQGEIPPPFAWVDTADGTLQTSDGVSVAPLGDHGNSDVTALPNGEGYGIRLDADWSGVSITGDILGSVPANTAAVLAIGYYLDTSRYDNVFRYQIGTAAYVDVGAMTHGLNRREEGVLLLPLSADEVTAWRESNVLNLLACPQGAQVAYIQSVRVIAPEYIAAPDVGCAYAATEEAVLCAYWPQVTGRPSHGMACGEFETNERYPDRPWLYRYYAVQKAWLANEEHNNRPVYIKIYAAEGHENDVIRIDSIERDAGQWGDGAAVQMTDGVGGVYVPYSNFTNGLNTIGSFRFWWTEAEKVARVELYDVAEYCTNPAADAARIAWLHGRMSAERVGTTLENYRVPTTEDEGYSGDIHCAACGVLLASGVATPRLPDSDLPAPYVRVDTATGVTWVSDGVTIHGSGAAGSDRAVPIGNTGKFGIRLDADWSGFVLTGEAFAAIPAGERAALAIEYYLDTSAGGQMFRYKVGGAPQVDFYTATSSLVHGQTGLVLCALSPEDVARLHAGEPLHILGCPGGVGVAYIQSVMVIAPQYAAGMKGEYDCAALVDMPLCPYYPYAVGQYNHGMPYADVREGYDAMGKLQRYTYFATTKAQAAADAKTSPVVIRFTLKEDSTLTEMTVDYQCARPQSLLDERVWASRTVAVNGTVVEVFLEDACFTNGLYEIGSFRVPNTEACPAADRLAAVEVVSVARREGLRAWIDRAEELTVEKTPASVAAFRAVVQAVTAVCADPWATADEIAEAEARIITAASALVPCAHRYADDKDTTCDDCGAVREVATALTGDVNKDEKVDSTDARLVLQYAVGKIDLNALDIAAADADGNGKVDSTDARLILQYAVRKIDGFSKK